jgi:hypothetical protein
MMMKMKFTISIYTQILYTRTIYSQYKKMSKCVLIV